MLKGKLIAIYGINNIGKSTQTNLLVEKLRREGYKTEYVKYPVYYIEPTGPFLNNVLRSESQKISEDELQLWFVLNRYQFQANLKKMLEKGTIVIVEDYVGTGVAWGMAKGLEEDWLLSMNRHLIKEDFVVLIEGNRDLEVREAIHVHEQDNDLMKKCELVFSNLADEFGWKRVLRQEKIEDTSELICELVKNYLTE